MRKSALSILPILSLICTIAAASPRYAVTVLPIIPHCINNKGHITGAWTRPCTHVKTAVLYKDGKVIDLDPTDRYDPVCQSRKTLEAGAINDRDEVLGITWSDGAILSVAGCRWANGKIEPVVADCGYGGSAPTSINNSGEMIGWAHGQYVEDDGQDAVYWKSGAAEGSNLSKKMHWRHSEATDINNRGDIVGKWEDEDGIWHAFLLSNGHLTNIELPGTKPRLLGAAINDKRQIVGAYNDDSVYNTPTHLFMWQDGRLSELEGFDSCPTLNNNGQMVGTLHSKSKQPQPCLWSGGQRWNLNMLISRTSGITINDVGDINDRGQILAEGVCKGKTAYVLLTPLRAAVSKSKSQHH